MVSYVAEHRNVPKKIAKKKHNSRAAEGEAGNADYDGAPATDAAVPSPLAAAAVLGSLKSLPVS